MRPEALDRRDERRPRLTQRLKKPEQLAGRGVVNADLDGPRIEQPRGLLPSQMPDCGRAPPSRRQNPTTTNVSLRSHFVLIQAGDRPDRYSESARFDTMSLKREREHQG